MPTPCHRFLALILLSLIWGYSWVIIKIALDYADPFSFSALRVAFGALCLFVVLPLSGRSLKPLRVPELMALGVMQTGGFVGLSMWAAAGGAPGRTAVLVFTMPFWAMLLAWLYLKESVQRYQWVTALIAGAGLLLVLQPWTVTGHTQGKMLAVASGFVWAVSAVMVKRMQARAPMDLLSMTAWQMLFGSVPLAAIAALNPGMHVQWTMSFSLALAFNAIATTAIGWWLWLYVLRVLPIGTAGMSTFAIPVIAMLASWLQLGEQPNTVELAGLVLIAAALLILTLIALRQHREVIAPVGQE
ncbi:MAG: putative cystine transporter YijE [Gammaproteobacteria bacterium]|nr:putative cystine transporter YijE [Gammaproteobacteria bacterium]